MGFKAETALLALLASKWALHSRAECRQLEIQLAGKDMEGHAGVYYQASGAKDNTESSMREKSDIAVNRCKGRDDGQIF